LKMCVQYEVGGFVESKGHAVWFDIRRGARLPEKEMAVGIKNCGLDDQLHTRKADASLFLCMARGFGAVDQHVGVMHEAFVAWTNLDGFQPARAIDRSAEDEVPILIASTRWKRVRL